MTLHHCGAENADDAKFCSGCGERIAAPAPASKKACPECRAENETNARFCTACGSRIDVTTAVATVAVPVVRSTIPSWRYLAAGGAMVIVLAVAAGWWLGNSGSADSARATAPSQSRTANTRQTSTTATAADTPATPNRVAQAQALHGKTRIEARSPREACADRENFLSRNICETSKCSEAAYAKHPICLELYERQNRNDSQRSEGYVQ